MNVLSLFDGISCGQKALERANIKVDKYYASEIDKYAIAITQKNYSDTIQLGDITKIKGNDLPQIDLMIGGSPCFISGTDVIAEDGIKKIEDIIIGDKVLTHENRFKKVVKIGNEYSENIISIKAQGISEITCTEKHPFYIRKSCWKNSIRIFSNPEWKEAKSLTKGYFVGFPILNTNENLLNITEEEAFIIGRYIADGHTRKDFRVSENRPNDRHWQMILSIGDKKLEKFKLNIKENNYSCYKHTQSVYRCVFSSKRLVEIVEKHCGCGAENKYISMTLLNLPENLLKILIDGYLSGDGSFRNNTYRASTVSESLGFSLRLAIAKAYKVGFSYEYNKRLKKCLIQGRVVNQRDSVTISFSKVFKKQCNFKVIDNIIWFPIKSTIKKNVMVRVYNLEVEDDNSFTSNGVFVHNCTGFSLAGKQLNFNDPQSKLFFEYVRLLKEIKPKYFLLENVKMKKEYQDIITEHLGVEPIMINSSLLSAQNRKRLYWTNIPNITQPEDKGIMMKDIIHESKFYYMINQGNDIKKEIEKSHTLMARDYKGYGNQEMTGVYENIKEYIIPFDKTLKILEKEVEDGKVGYFRKDSQANRVYYIHGKSVTLCGESGGGAAKMGQYLFGCITPDRENKRQNGQRFNDGNKFYILTAQDNHGILIEGYIRRLTPIECERLQTLEDDYTKIGIMNGKEVLISNTQRYKCLGNGWTVDVIAHILGEIK